MPIGVLTGYGCVSFQERLVYLNHIYQLAASARSVVAENKDLRGRLEALQTGTSALVRPIWDFFCVLW